MPINHKYLARFETGNYFHIYNRSHSGRKMFTENTNYHYFLRLLKKHITNYIDIYAYCLLPTHFHLFVQVKDQQSVPDEQVNTFLSNQFKKFFIAYANAINKRDGTHGGIFSRPFRRVLIQDEAHFTRLMYYIHFNPLHHKICKDFSRYPYSSYATHLSDNTTFLQREKVLEWFGGRDAFLKYHNFERESYTTNHFDTQR